MNKNIKYMVAGIALILFVLPMSVSSETYLDKTCILGELFPGMPVYFCFNPDGGMDKSFLTYEAMDAYYSPMPMEVTYIPEITYQWTVSNMSP